MGSGGAYTRRSTPSVLRHLRRVPRNRNCMSAQRSLGARRSCLLSQVSTCSYAFISRLPRVEQASGKQAYNKKAKLERQRYMNAKQVGAAAHL